MAIVDVPTPALPLERLLPVIGRDRMKHLVGGARRAADRMRGRTFWNISSTATGGGVAEMLRVLVGYGRGAGLDLRWSVIEGDEQFFAITKRLHHWIHGMPGDAGPLSIREAEHYQEILRVNAVDLVPQVQRGDVVILHDPQTAGLASALGAAGAHVVWRCHIGADCENGYTQAAWDFLRPYLDAVEAAVFSRRAYVPSWMPAEIVAVVPPSIDPFSPKNQELDEATVRAILSRAGILAVENTGDARFVRRDGSQGSVVRTASVIGEGGPTSPDIPLVVQVSRWDPLKDMAGVMEAFARIAPDTHGELLLVGPATHGVSDDPEGATVLAECIERWRGLAQDVRCRVRLVTVPMDDVDENAAIVNAIQRHAAVIVQKSLAEGFGLTVTEAMWKGRAVLASAVGGIVDQLTESTGVLLDDPSDLDEASRQMRLLLEDPPRRATLGAAAQAHVRARYVGDRHLLRYARLLDVLLRN